LSASRLARARATTAGDAVPSRLAITLVSIALVASGRAIWRSSTRALGRVRAERDVHLERGRVLAHLVLAHARVEGGAHGLVGRQRFHCPKPHALVLDRGLLDRRLDPASEEGELRRGHLEAERRLAGWD